MDINFKIEFDSFYQGLSPVSHIDNQTHIGSRGHATSMLADVISTPGYIQQSPDLENLTNGETSELIRHILDRPIDANTTYAVGSSKLYKITQNEVVNGGSPSWPQTISGMTEGESVIRLKDNLFIFCNKATGGDIAAMPLSTGVIDNDWGATTDQALEQAPHPSAAKEDILMFGNGRYAGAYIEGAGLLDVQKLDFGQGAEVADIVFFSNMWWIAVNYGEGRRAQIYLYDGGAVSNILSDEVGLGTQKIGFLFVHNGSVFVAYDDITADGFAIGWVSGRSIKPLKYFTGSLPNHKQKTLYKNNIMFPAGDDIYVCGATVEQLNLQISALADGGYENIGAVSAPFGTPIISSGEGSNYRIAKFSGYSNDSNWKSVYQNISNMRNIGNIHTIIVYTKPLEANAAAKIYLEGDQGQKTSSSYQITGTNKTRHIFSSIDLTPVEDVRVCIDYSDSNNVLCQIRQIILLGNYTEI